MFGALNFFLTGKKAGIPATYLVIAGGGSGGYSASGNNYNGGGGAGGFRTSTLTVALNTAFTITVGAGGASGSGGSDSVFSSITSTGGGKGGGFLAPYTNGGNGFSGGSGGGGSGGGTGGTVGAGGAGNTPSTSPSQGNTGGSGYNTTQPSAGGGGGAGSVGADGYLQSGTVGNGGNGGSGTANSISGSSVTYAGGGGGGTGIGGVGGSGGSGGGGAGGTQSTNGTNATANTGSGGGGSGGNAVGGAGGSGVVIISIPVAYTATFSSGCTVTATVSGGNNIYTITATSSGSETVKFIQTPVTGSALGGGYFAGFISTTGNGTADYYLIVSPKSSGESQSSAWGPGTPFVSGTTDIDGPGNSTIMNSTTYPAAYFCKGLTIGGFSDWYSPATNELEVCYYNLKPGGVTNVTSSGINPNAVPARSSNYTTGSPPQTSATLFQAGQAQDFGQVTYWTSVQDPGITNRGKTQNFYKGGQGSLYKPSFGYNYRVRAVRRVAV